jgi:hypothetical protein
MKPGDDFVMMDESKLLKEALERRDNRRVTEMHVKLRSEYEQLAAAFRTSELMLKNAVEEIRSLATANKILVAEASEREKWLADRMTDLRRKLLRRLRNSQKSDLVRTRAAITDELDQWASER